MTSPAPFTGPGPSPLALYLRGERFAVQGIEEDLRDAMADTQRRINRLETKAGIGSVVRRAQLALVRRELRGVQESLWRSIGKRIRAASPRIAAAAHEAERVLQAITFRAVGQEPPEELEKAQGAFAQRAVANYLARGENGVGLSARVYKTKALSNQWVDRAINRSLLAGDGWQELAKRVRPMIDPDTPGGVSYAAKRLARTELNNAFHTTQRETAKQNPFVTALQWNLSLSHARLDRCDELAEAGPYEPDELPSKPHPQCLCFMTNVMMDEDDFLDLVTSEEFLEGTLGDYQEASKELKKTGTDNVVPIKPKPKPAPKKAPPPAPPQPKEGEAALSAIPKAMWELDPDRYEEEILSLQGYKGFAYLNVNNYLREGSGEYYKDIVQGMDKVLDSSRLKNDAVFYRGVKEPRKWMGDMFDGDLTGLEWQDDSYSSMSADERVATDFAVRKEGTGMIERIVVRKGAPVLKLSDWAREGQETRIYEAEGLGGRGWRKRIVADHGFDENGVRRVDVEVISHGRNGKNPWSR